MTITTKFEEGDLIFFIHNAKVLVNTVRGFKIERLRERDSSDCKTSITYLCSPDESEKQVFLKVDESIAFATKEELLLSL